VVDIGGRIRRPRSASEFSSSEYEEGKLVFRSLTWIATLVALVLAVGVGNAAAEDATYAGVKKCKTCHKKELIGDQYSAWQKAKHSKAYETLKSDKALEIAKQAGLSGAPSESADCLKCHVTAYEEGDSMFEKARLDPKNGVQCESCHGPGSLYKKKKIMADHDKSVAAGMWEPGKDEKICTKCHNDQSPTWDAAAGFDHKKRMEEIAHPIPKDVKGRYLEAEKAAKEAKKAAGEAG
jgi:hypothetical protein